MITAIKEIKKNLYRVLDLNPSASHNDIIHAYNRIKKAYGKDALASYSLIDEDSSKEILAEIEFAYTILGNASKKREYDLAMGYADKKSFEEESRLAPQPLPKKVEATESKEEAPVRLISSRKAPQKNPEFEDQINSCQFLSGAFLKAVRIYRGLSEEQLAQFCQLNPHHIFTIEEEDYSRLPHPTYLRGHLLLICRYLEIENAEQLVKEYVDRLKEEKKLPTSSFAG